MSAKEYDEALARLIEVIKAHSVYALEKQGFHTLADTLRKFLAADDLNEANKICEQINTLLPMNRINAVGQAFIKGTIRKHWDKVDVLAIIANFEVDKLVKVYNLLCKLRCLSIDTCAIGQGILDVENRSHEEMTERLEKTEESEETKVFKPSTAFVITLKDSLSEEEYNKWSCVFSRSPLKKDDTAKEKYVCLTWSQDSNVKSLHRNLLEDSSISQVERWYTLDARLIYSKHDLTNIFNYPDAWALRKDNRSEPLWAKRTDAQQATDDLAKLTNQE